MKGNFFSSNTAACIDLFEMDQDDVADSIVLPTKQSGRRAFKFMQNGKVKPWSASKGDHSYSRRDVDCPGRAERLERKRAVQEMRMRDDDGDFRVSKAVRHDAISRCGTQAPIQKISSDVEDFGGVKVIKDKTGRIIAAFAGGSDYSRPKKKTRRAQARPEVVKAAAEKVEKTSDELARGRRRRRKEAKQTRWLQPLPANHWRRSRDGDNSLTHDPITGRRYDELPAAQKDAVVRQRLDALQARVDALPSYLQEEVMSGLTSESWPWYRMTQLVKRLVLAEREMRVPHRFFFGVVPHEVSA